MNPLLDAPAGHGGRTSTPSPPDESTTYALEVEAQRMRSPYHSVGGLRATTQESVLPETAVLEPYINVTDHLREIIDPWRCLALLLCVGVACLGMSTIPPEEFSVMITLPNVESPIGCMHYCQRSQIDPGFSSMLEPPGVGRCWDDVHNTSLVTYEVCHRQNARELAQCTTDTGQPPEEGLFSTRCSFPVVPAAWKPYVVLGLLVIVIMLILQDFPPELPLIGGACLLCPFGIISSKDVFAGFSNEGVCALAVLFPISEAIAETGMLEKAVGIMLGRPKTLSAAIPRMMLPTALLSAILSNTATVAMLIPIIVSWARRLDVHPGKLLMPLSFAAQLGGSWTLMGSSHILVAKSVIPAQIYDMGFFDLFPVGVLITLITVAVIVAVAPTDLLMGSLAGPEASREPADGAAKDVYELRLVVNQYGGLVGSTITESGLTRMAGVFTVRRVPDEPEVMGCEDVLLQAGDTLLAQCSERGVISLRSHMGIHLQNHQDLSLLGARRRERHLYEVTIKPSSDERIEAIFALPYTLRRDFGACVVAGPKAPLGSSRERLKITAGSVMLLEAHERKVTGKHWSQFFSLVHQIPNSSPLRLGLPIDNARSTMTCMGMVALILFVTLDRCTLASGGGILLVFYLIIRSLSPRQLVNSIRGNILVTIAGAIAFATGLRKAGVVHFMAHTLLGFAKPFGIVGVLGMVYLITFFLGLFINNSAIVAILGPMVIAVANDNTDMDVKALVWTLVYGAGTCFTTPLGYQTNLMVMPDGKYSFRDFIRFGGLIQFCHFLQTILLCSLLPQHM